MSGPSAFVVKWRPPADAYEFVMETGARESTLLIYDCVGGTVSALIGDLALDYDTIIITDFDLAEVLDSGSLRCDASQWLENLATTIYVIRGRCGTNVDAFVNEYAQLKFLDESNIGDVLDFSGLDAHGKPNAHGRDTQTNAGVLVCGSACESDCSCDDIDISWVQDTFSHMYAIRDATGMFCNSTLDVIEKFTSDAWDPNTKSAYMCADGTVMWKGLNLPEPSERGTGIA